MVAQRTANFHIACDRAVEDIVTLRATRDARLPMPKLIVPSLQINVRGDKMPPADESGPVMLKLPINTL